ncbi:MAG: MBL fold metallo-hydrolase RNA specificity domain-containing protein, partial [Bacillota bacterium]
DYVVMESTYGNRVHEDKAERSDLLKRILQQAVKDQERVIIPAFAVGRTQDILYEISQLYAAGDIPLIPVYVDSPLAISATEIFARHPEDFDEETWAMIQSGKSPFDYAGLQFTREVEQSRALNDLQGPAVIISASGMCEAGRIKHHLKHNLWRPGAQVLFVGYQAEGTLGRRIKDGSPEVTIFGEQIAVNARVNAIEGFSAHGDQEDLSHWISGFVKKPKRVFVTHGEPTSRRAWAETLASQFGLVPIVPELGQEYDLEKDATLVTTVQAAPSPQEADMAILDALWYQARPALLRALTAKGRKLPRQGERLLNKLAEMLQEIIIKLGR